MTAARRPENTANDCCPAGQPPYESGGYRERSTATVAILGTRYVDFSVEEAILGPLGVRVVGGDGATADDVTSQARDAEVVLAGSGPRFDAAVISQLRCRGIVRYGVGVESIDLEAAARAGKWVAYVPDYGTDSVAVHAVTMLLAGLRRLVRADETVKQGGWGLSALRPLHAPPATTVGIVGFGRIGRRVAELLEPFGFELVAHDAHVDVSQASSRVRAVSFEEMLSVDALTLHAPAPPGGRPLLGASELRRLKPGSVLVNTARGSLVDEAALMEGLRRGAPAVAALDVFTGEPPGDRFATVAEHVILSPHMAWYTEESELDLRTKAAHEAARILEGKPPLNPAVQPAIPQS